MLSRKKRRLHRQQMVNSGVDSRQFDSIEAGLRATGAESGLVLFAQERLTRWLTEPSFAPYRPQLERLIAEDRWSHLLDAFCRVLPFGTGGRRGAVGIGPNRLNLHTISLSVQGHVNYLRHRFGGTATLRVVLAYDVRKFMDFGQQYVAGVPNPVLGLTSRAMAEQAARIYAANQVEVYIQATDDARFMSTPELSFALRFHKAHGGLNISASHNPPDDNGAKFYNQQGGQFVPPNDAKLIDFVNAVEVVQEMTWEEATASGFVHWLDGSAYRAYLTTVSEQSRNGRSGYRIAFTGLHGSGTWSVPPVLRQAGFQVCEEPAQLVADGSFETVPGRAPNPEIPACMDRGIRFAEEQGCTLLLGTDPDADRIGACVKAGGKWRFLTGNEIAALTVYRALQRHPEPNTAIVMRTEVTSQLVTRIAKSFGAKVVDNLLVGFKYIGEGLRQLETQGQFEGVSGKVTDFCIGVEESHGILTTQEIRDKDAAGGALLLAELAEQTAREGNSLVDVLDRLMEQHGAVVNRLTSTVMRGVMGRERIVAILDSLRLDPPSAIGGMRVTSFIDHRNEMGSKGPRRSDTDWAARNVLVFQMGDTARLIVRPSGTEPKCKVYGEYVGRTVSEAVTSLNEMTEEFLELMLNRVDLELPRWGHGASDQLTIESKMAFATLVLPKLVADLKAGKGWTTQRLIEELAKIDVSEPRWVAGAVRRWCEQHTAPAGLAKLFGI